MASVEQSHGMIAHEMNCVMACSHCKDQDLIECYMANSFGREGGSILSE